MRLLLTLILIACLSGCGLRPQPGKGTGSGDRSTSSEVSRAFHRVLEEQRKPRAGEQVKELARSLVSEGQSDREKAYALYRWIGENIAYNVEGLYSGDLGDNSPDAVLRDRVAVCAGYADLFYTMCQEVGVECEVIPGRSRALGNELPPSLRDSETNHAWNAVRLDGQWYLLDATWGAGHVTPEREFVKEPNDDWFMVEPEIFINSHLPQEPRWQLLEPTLTQQEFETLPDLTPRFYQAGLELLEPRVNRVECVDEMQIRVRSTDSHVVTGRVMQNDTWLPPGTSFVYRSGDESLVAARFPGPGQYEVHLMLSRPGDEELQSVGKFQVQATRGTDDLFPETYLTYKEHGCELIEPESGVLAAGRTVPFVVRIPDAEKAVVKNGDQMIPMERHGDTFSVNHAPVSGELQIMGGFDQSNRVWAVLKYSVE